MPFKNLDDDIKVIRKTNPVPRTAFEVDVVRHPFRTFSRDIIINPRVTEAVFSYTV